ncbi:hypothetical protein C10C_1043 [Chlamydia serpentis]|uniref:Uncharacterized protein n=1 Tax=Chlamydia serpentis TaxID=1967782 RepID=A0A2R8FCN3_9CHLA|nr:hypothetical protein [Chlamydia serpentis]SPN74174.1 hypothetical protein C10C_1043 [Chlamydia serpentis]
MVCPSNFWSSLCGSCTVQWSEVRTEETGGINLGGETSTNTVVTTQPKITKVEKHLQFTTTAPDDSVLKTIQEAGNLVDAVLSHQRTQRCAAYCYESCSDGCSSYCGAFGRFVCGIYNACCFDQENAISNLVRECDKIYGPICVALAAKHMSWNLMELAESNAPLSEEEKNSFKQQCAEAKDNLYGTMSYLSQQFFFKGVDSIREQGLENSLIQTVLNFIATRSWEKAETSIQEGATSSLQSSPTCYVLTSTPLGLQTSSPTQPEARRPSYVPLKNEQNLANKINLKKIQKELAKIQVINLKTGEVCPMGHLSCLLVRMLEHFLIFVGGGPSSNLGLTGAGICYTSEQFLEIIILLLLCIGYCPIATDSSPGIDKDDLTDPIILLFYQFQHAYQGGKGKLSKQKPALLRQTSIHSPTPADSFLPGEESDEEEEEKDDDIVYQNQILECSGHLQTIFLGINKS